MSASSVVVSSTSVSRVPAHRAAGFWMVIVLIGYILVNAVRSTYNPQSFAAYYGIPLADPHTTGFVFVYAIRALFLGLFGLALLIRRDYPALVWYSLIGCVMPVGDAILVAVQHGGSGTVARHALTAGFLLLTGILLRRWIMSK
ncbi:MAG TPA: DUF4267 domain-containing protein [Acidobacteriota bacterium]|nr:DUF4267 domain-containing protein [Acidobacteriota bacterium]HNH82364.1 DUF4267 domain-containing protein [Acidobacteriota bacterium]HNJ39452.1 DUF4267 domain-containing protein [Acidobacteriota bacterium]